jgi:plasmid maintenance system antidote protein VapI
MGQKLHLKLRTLFMKFSTSITAKGMIISMNFFETIGNNILVHIEKNNLSKTILAEKVGISSDVLDKIIEGKKAINSYEISKIAEILGISTDLLLNTNDKILLEQDSLDFFAEAFINIDNFKLLYYIIEEYINMESDLHEFLQSKKHFA